MFFGLGNIVTLSGWGFVAACSVMVEKVPGTAPFQIRFHQNTNR